MIPVPAFDLDQVRLPIDEVAGLPLHPLVVHAVVVLVPLSALGLIVMATSGARSKRYSPAVIFVAAVATVAAVIAEISGNQFRHKLGIRASDHFQYGEYVPWAALAVLVLACVLGLMDKQSGGNRNAVGSIVAIVGILVSLGAVAITVLTGHSGAQLVWG